MSLLLVLAILPVFFLCFFIYKKDVNREPGKLLAKIFALGFFSAIPVVIVELLLGNLFPTDGIDNFLVLFINVFVGVALIEEGFKWFITKIFGYNNKEFDEVEKEWVTKKEEINQLKKEAREMDAIRMEELVNNLDSIGLMDSSKMNLLKVSQSIFMI